MKKNLRKTKNVTLPAGTVELLCEMFTSNQGVDMANIINDLSVNGNRGLVTINLGLLMQGKILQLPETKYSVSDNNNRVYVNILEESSLLKDVVRYKQYRFDYNQEAQSYEQYDYIYCEECQVCDWFDKLDELPDGIKLPEIVNKD